MQHELQFDNKDIRSRTKHLKVLRISHSGSVSAYRERERQLISRHAVDLRLIIPERWEHLGGKDGEICEDFAVIKSQTFGTGSIPLFIYDPVSVARTLLDFKPDIFDVHEEPYSVSCFELFSMARRLSPKTACVFYSAQNIRKRYPPPFSWMERYVYSMSQGAYPCSGGVADVLRSKGFTRNIATIPLGVDVDFFKPKTVRRADFSLDSKYVIGYFGRLEQYKGVDILLRAFSQLVEQSCQLLIVGSGEFGVALRALARELGIADRIVWTGGVEMDLIPDYLNSCDVIVVPSCTTPTWKEQFGRVVVEAMACGVPVIASDSGSLPEVVDKAGVIVPEKDVEALSFVLNQLIEYESMREMYSRLGLNHVQQNFTWSRVADMTFDFYARALAGMNCFDR